MQNSVTTDPIGEEGLREQVSMAVDGAGFFLACDFFFGLQLDAKRKPSQAKNERSPCG